MILGDCLEVMKGLPGSVVDSLVTDPPAGISFMGKGWDSNKGGRDCWIAWLTEIMTECFRVLKPGAHGLVWALPRTSHWTATALENSGFEIRDIITHIFGSGFPKSLNLGNGLGTGIKPANEHWILIRKPVSEKTIALNIGKYGTGGLNIDGARIATNDKIASCTNNNIRNQGYTRDNKEMPRDTTYNQSELGRFPANLVLSHNDDCGETCSDGCAVSLLDGQSGILKSGALESHHVRTTTKTKNTHGVRAALPEQTRASSGGASRFFYCAKASKSDRGEENTHPTVKSTKLMSYLIKLVTPPTGTVLDPFMGSGSTGLAAKKGGFGFFGIEQDKQYFGIAQKRGNV